MLDYLAGTRVKLTDSGARGAYEGHVVEPRLRKAAAITAIYCHGNA